MPPDRERPHALPGGGFGNEFSVGLPILSSVQGRGELGISLLIDRLGLYLVLVTVDLFVATTCVAKQQPGIGANAARVATFPLLIALVAALLSRCVSVPAEFDRVLIRIDDTLTPLALISVGLRLRIEAIEHYLKPLAVGFASESLVCPALVIAVLAVIYDEINMTTNVSVIEAAMLSMTGAGVMAAHPELDAPLVSSSVGARVPIVLCTAFGWHWLFIHLLA